MADVFINSRFVGTVKNGSDFRNQIVSERRFGKLDPHLNVFYDEDHDAVFLETSQGRSQRPLIVVNNGKPALTDKHIEQLEKKEIQWSDLVKQGVIEYLDAAEEENALIAFTEEELTPEHTHLEVSTVGIVGIATGLVPFAHHNHGARLMQGSKNQKQAIGFYASNFYARLDMDVNIMHYPQEPIVRTLINEVVETAKHPLGQNVCVAVMSYKGYNMEDAIIMNEGSVQRGLARSTYFRPIESEELRYAGGLVDEIGIPDKDTKGYRTEHDYRFLDEDGLVSPEAKVQEGDVVIGKTSPPRFLNAMDEYNLATNYRRESSMSLKHSESGTVDFVVLTENEEGNKLVQVRLRDERPPVIGDKFTSRHGQKGVIALIVPEADMPFTASGMKPDIIFNPHGIPSRMTVSHMIELLAGKVGALSGRMIDATIFNSEPEAALRKELLRHGFRENGVEQMYNGETGEPFQTRVFMGNQYYLRLKHMVKNKVHSRARGPIQLLTRQPTEGKAKEGGLRLGEMEKDTFVAHGASLLLKERFDSDSFVTPVCERSGLVASYDARRDRAISDLYGEAAKITDVEMSYAFKLLLDELKSLCIYPKLKLKSKY
ncbi:DNA-directed RNA polymerase subunit B [Candidatus Woesearchaeota archaeon]|nr:MAG: DNA-directed RNA polymerase subunit B [Candidatus Woesearchaeota archaeon]